MRRRAPRPVAPAPSSSLASAVAPATPLGAVQGAWPAAVGAASPPTRAAAERDGALTVYCAASVWAQEVGAHGRRVVAARQRRRPAAASALRAAQIRR